MLSIVRTAVAVGALFAATLSLVPSGVSASETEPWKDTSYDVNATWYFPMYGRIAASSDQESVLKYQPAPYNTMPYQYHYECQVIPGTTPLRVYPRPQAPGGAMTSGLVKTVVRVFVPVLLSPSVIPDPKKFVYVCRGSLLLNGVDIAVHDGSDISSDTVYNEFNNLTHTIYFKIDKSKLALVPK